MKFFNGVLGQSKILPDTLREYRPTLQDAASSAA